MHGVYVVTVQRCVSGTDTTSKVMWDSLTCKKIIPFSFCEEDVTSAQIALVTDIPVTFCCSSVCWTHLFLKYNLLHFVFAVVRPFIFTSGCC